MFYVAGFIWAEIKQLYQEGLHQYMVIDKQKKFFRFVRNECFILGGYMEFIRLDYQLSLCSYYCTTSHGVYQSTSLSFLSMKNINKVDYSTDLNL